MPASAQASATPSVPILLATSPFAAIRSAPTTATSTRRPTMVLAARGIDLDDVVDAEASELPRGRAGNPAAGAASRRRPVQPPPLVQLPDHPERRSPARGGEGPCVAVGEDPHRVAGTPAHRLLDPVGGVAAQNPVRREILRHQRSSLHPPPHRGPGRSAARPDRPPAPGSPPWAAASLTRTHLGTQLLRSPAFPSGLGQRHRHAKGARRTQGRRPPHDQPLDGVDDRIDRHAGDERLLTRQERLVEQAKTAFGPVPVDSRISSTRPIGLGEVRCDHLRTTTSASSVDPSNSSSTGDYRALAGDVTGSVPELVDEHPLTHQEEGGRHELDFDRARTRALVVGTLAVGAVVAATLTLVPALAGVPAPPRCRTSS